LSCKLTVLGIEVWDQADHFPRQFGQIQRLNDKLPLSRISQQLLREVRRPLAAVDDIVDQPPRRVEWRHAVSDQAGVTENADQKIIEIVGDSAGQNSDALQFGGLAKLVLQSLSLGDIPSYE
jgi:hypothetical protein